MAQDPFGLVGLVLDGQFRVDRHVGEGGFSIVYAGTHIGLSEPIAIKCLKLPPSLGSALVDSFVARFRDESRLHYRLSQGNLHIVRSMASGTTISPATRALVPYTVLEWLEGHSLAEEFADRRAAGLRGRSMREVVELLDSAAQAMAYAHAQGVVHRDLNPGNLFLARTPGGVKLKILDFGVAKILTDSSIAMNPTARTVGNIRMFAPAYGAPEQFDERLGAIGPWTDVYAITLTILEALTDVTVMEGEHLGEFATLALDTRRPTPRTLGIAVGDEVEKTLASAVALDPSRRPRDAGELWGLLKHAIQVDARSGRPAHARLGPPPGDQDAAPATLRMDGLAPDARGDGRPSGPPTHALGGTLKIDRGSFPQRLSATELLTTAAAPQRPSRVSFFPGGAANALDDRPSPYAPTIAVEAKRASGAREAAPSNGRDAASAYTSAPRPAAFTRSSPSAPPTSVARVLLVFFVLLVAVAGLSVGAAYGWRSWHAHGVPAATP